MRYQRPPHLTVRAGIHYFRMSVPGHLRGRVGRREFKVSLKTRDPLQARVSCRRLSTYFEKVIDTVAKNPTLTKKDIDQMVRRHFEVLVDDANEMRHMARVFIPGSPPKPLPGFNVKEEVLGAQRHLVALREEIKTYASEQTRATAKRLLEGTKFSSVSLASDEFSNLCDGVLRAEMEGTRLLISLLEGRLENAKVKDALFDGVDLIRLPPPLDGEAESLAPPPETLGQLAALYCEQKKASGEWAISAQQENRRALDWFMLEYGIDTPAQDVTLESVRGFRDILMKLPPNFAKVKKYHGLSLSEIADMAEGPTLAPKTRVKAFTALRAFFQWCVVEGHLKASPVGELTMSSKKVGRSTRRKFTDEELKRLFASPLYAGCKGPKRRNEPGDHVIRDGLFWLPLVGLYSGMRIAEIIQLPASHVRETEGVKYFDLTGIKLKNLNSERQVPIHPDLVRLGFMEYVDQQTKLGPDARVFEDFSIGSEKDPAGPASKRINRYFRKMVSEDRDLVFHSFRYCMTDALRRAGVEKWRRDRITGHAGEGAADTDYDSVLGAVYLAKDMEKVSYPVDLSHLYVPESFA